jgi:hypothetical protein
MLPLTGVPPTIARGMKTYREVFCRDEGFEHVSRYVSGLILSPNKTLQGIHAQQVWPEGEEVSRRAMHAAVFEAGWSGDELIKTHRQVVAVDHRGRGREVISVDWTQAHHERGPEIYGVKEVYDYVLRRNSLLQTVVTAAVANRELVDGLAVEVQQPDFAEAELEYLRMTAQENYSQMEQVEKRLIELVSYQRNRLAYRKRTEMAVEIVRQIEDEGHFPHADYAFDNGVLTRELTKLIEERGKHWVSEIESSRHINWMGQWRRVDEVAEELRTRHPESFRYVKVKVRNGNEREYWAFTKVVRLKKGYGRKRLVIVHEQAELSDTPRFLLTDAQHWESGRTIQVWSYRWPVEVFHEFSKQVTGFESAQVRKEEAVNRHFRLSCVAQSLVQRAASSGGKSERFQFAEEKATVGQKVFTIAREALGGVLQFAHGLFAQGRSCDQVLQVLMPT